MLRFAVIKKKPLMIKKNLKGKTSKQSIEANKDCGYEKIVAIRELTVSN